MSTKDSPNTWVFCSSDCFAALPVDLTTNMLAAPVQQSSCFNLQGTDSGWPVDQDDCACLSFGPKLA
jgi:hypothetical protein